MRSEKEVDKMIEEMIKRTKGRYITQGVSFNKTCPRQLDLLKKALMSSVSFSGLAKEALALRFDGKFEDMTLPKMVMGEMGKGKDVNLTHLIPIIEETKPKQHIKPNQPIKIPVKTIQKQQTPKGTGNFL